MLSATAMPSSSALCASIGPSITSPIGSAKDAPGAATAIMPRPAAPSLGAFTRASRSISGPFAASAVRAALNDAVLEADGVRTVSLGVVFSDVFRTGDWRRTHAVLRVRAVTEAIEESE